MHQCHDNSFSEIFYLEHYMLLTKRAHQCTILQTLNALMKFHLITHATLETTKPGLIQIFHYCSVSWKITPLYFVRSNLCSNFGQKQPIKEKYLDFLVVGWNLKKFLMSYLKLQVRFSSNFASLFSVMKDNSSVIF